MAAEAEAAREARAKVSFFFLASNSYKYYTKATFSILWKEAALKNTVLTL